VAAYRDGKQWRWRRQIRLPGSKKKVRLSGTPAINTKAAALEAEHAAVEETLAGRTAHRESPTLASVADEYLAHVRLRRSPALADNRASQFRTHLIRFFGRKRLEQIGLAMIDRFVKERVASGLAPGTINQNLLGLSNFLRWAKAREYVAEVPAIELLPRPSKDSDDLEHLEDDELNAIINAALGQLRNMIVFAAHTGLRAGELLALRWEGIDHGCGRVTVRRSLYRTVERPPKGKRSRSIPLSQSSRAALKSQRHLRGPYVFCDQDGRRLVYSTALEHAQAAGLAGWHVLRHTFGTMLATRGVPLRAIQEWMGHRDIKTTMVYAHFSPVLEEAISVLDTGETWQHGAKRPTPPPKSDGETDE
jgi:integrase